MMKEAAGALHRVNVGMRVMITAPSFFAHLRDLASTEPRKLRQPKTMFKPRPRPRPRTPQELEGLRKGNEARAEEAQKRREAKGARSRLSLRPQSRGPQGNGRSRRVKASRPKEAVSHATYRRK